jgi:hypothetical protein
MGLFIERIIFCNFHKTYIIKTDLLFNARDHDNDSWENIVKEYSIGILKMKFEYKKNEWESIRKSMKVYDQNTLR